MSAAVLLMYLPEAYGEGVPAIPVTSGACRVAAADKADAVAQTRELTARTISNSFPKLAGRTIDFEAFESPSTFFKTRFSVTRYLTLRGTRIMLSVNPCVFELRAPPDGIEAIIAHELAHAENYIHRNLFDKIGLIKLVGSESLARFERRTDLLAIERGYGAGLKAYREWLYQNVPPENVEKKRRNYFSPDEIDAIREILEADPQRFRDLYRNVPMRPIENRGGES